MCLAVPACIVRVEGETALFDIGGIRRSGSVALIEAPAPGEWVILHTGVALTRIDPQAAAALLAELRALEAA